MPIVDTPVFPDVAPWPDRPAPAPVGHNKPPVEDEARATFREALLSAAPDFEQKVDDFEASVNRVLVDDDDSLGRAAEFVRSLRDAAKVVNDAHAKAKAPYLAGGRAVDDARNAINSRLDRMKAEVTDRSNRYIARREAAERARQAEEQAQMRRQQEEADAAEALRQEAASVNDAEAIAAVPVVAAPVMAARRSEPVRSDSGVIATARTVMTSEVFDYDAAYAEVRDNPKVKEAIDKAVASLVRAGKREIRGVRITQGRQMVAR